MTCERSPDRSRKNLLSSWGRTLGTVRSRDDATTRSRGRGCQRDETHRGRHLRREIDSTARARGEGSALSERDLTRDRWKPRKRSGRSNDGRGKRSVARDATVFVRVCARSVDANAGGRWTSGHRSMRRSRCVRPCVGKCASCGGKRALSTLFLRVHVHVCRRRRPAPRVRDERRRRHSNSVKPLRITSNCKLPTGPPHTPAPDV